MANNNIILTKAQLNIVLNILAQYLPDIEVWAYGSRVNGNARINSDLDMVAFLSASAKMQLFAAREAFSESSLPFRVDLFSWNEIPPLFQWQIQKQHLLLQCQPVREQKQVDFRNTIIELLKSNLVSHAVKSGLTGEKFQYSTQDGIADGINLGKAARQDVDAATTRQAQNVVINAIGDFEHNYSLGTSAITIADYTAIDRELAKAQDYFSLVEIALRLNNEIVANRAYTPTDKHNLQLYVMKRKNLLTPQMPTRNFALPAAQPVTSHDYIGEFNRHSAYLQEIQMRLKQARNHSELLRFTAELQQRISTDPTLNNSTKTSLQDAVNQFQRIFADSLTIQEQYAREMAKYEGK